jgi:hypothetical protein
MRKDTWSVCHPTVRKGYRSVCHRSTRKDTWSVCHPWSVCCRYGDVSNMLRKHKQSKINTYHKYLHYKIISCSCRLMPCIVGDAAPPTPSIHLLLSLLGFFRHHICVRSCKYFIMICLVGDAAPPHTPCCTCALALAFICV